MTQEEKDLLIKDLCARLPYGVKFLRESWNYECDQELSVIELLEDIDKDGYINNTKVYTVEDIKPYLRPMSSMTEEESKEYTNIDNRSYSCPTDYAHIPASDRIDWLLKNHFDYRGLIPKGLAIEVTEENNPYQLD